MADQPGEKTVVTSDVEDKTAKARAVIMSLERALQTRKLYMSNHQLFIDSTQDVVRKFLKFFEKYSYLRIDVQLDGLMFDKAPLLQAEQHEANIPMRLYKDGIRQIRFRNTLRRKEIVQFLDLFEMQPKVMHEMGEDMVSLIWTRDFPSIDYAVVDEFDGDEAGIALTSRQKKAVEQVLATLARITEALTTVEALPDKQLPDKSDVQTQIRKPSRSSEGREETKVKVDTVREFMSGDLGPTAYRVWQEIEYETLSGAIRRSFQILFEVFEQSAEGEQDDLAPLLMGVALIHLRKGDLGSLGEFLTSARDSKILTKTRRGRELEMEIRKEIDASVKSQTLVKYLNDHFNGDYEGFTKFLEFAGAGYVERISAVYGEIKEDHLREIIRNYLIRWKDAISLEHAKQMLSNFTKQREEIFLILGEATPRGLMALLYEYFSGFDNEGKKTALGLIVRLAEPGRLKIFEDVVKGAAAEVRAAAYRVMAKEGDFEFHHLLLENVKSKAFLKKEPWEKVLAMHALANCSGATKFVLMRKFIEDKPPMFNKPKWEETRRAAVMAMAGIDVPQAQDYIRQGVGHRDPRVRQYCEEAIREKERQDQEGGGPETE